MLKDLLATLLLTISLCLAGCGDDAHVAPGAPDAATADAAIADAAEVDADVPDADPPEAPDAEPLDAELPDPPDAETSGGTCHGAATPCSQVGPGQCASQHGCFGPPERCEGRPSPCAAFDGNMPGCVHQPGCTWNTAGNLCGGAANGCSTQPNLMTCNEIQGCYWHFTTCMGMATPCTGLPQNTCAAQHGCSWN
jgi:hypothetical protein